MSDFSSPPPPPPPPGFSQYGGGSYEPPRRLGKATAAMVCGIIGLLVVPIVFGPLALVLGIKARNEMKRSPGRYTNSGMATAGIVCGIIAILLIPLYAVLFFS